MRDGRKAHKKRILSCDHLGTYEKSCDNSLYQYRKYI